MTFNLNCKLKTLIRTPKSITDIIFAARNYLDVVENVQQSYYKTNVQLLVKLEISLVSLLLTFLRKKL